MSENVVIEPYGRQGPDRIFGLILPIQTEEFGVRITRADQPDLEDIPGFYQHGTGNFWVALDGEEVVGTVALIDIGDRQVALRKMFVRADHRGTPQAVARRLLETALAWTKCREVTAVFLGTTAQYKAAHRFYEKNGFRVIAKETLPPSFPLVHVDTVFYQYAF